MSELKAPGIDSFLGDDEVVITLLSPKDPDISMKFVFGNLDTTTLRKYRTIYNGPPGSRRGKPQEAVLYLFREKFRRSEGITIPDHEYGSETEFWLKHPRASLLADSAVNAYLGKQLAEEDDVKK